MSQSPTFAVSSGLLDPEHVEALGPALWEFLLLVNWQTNEEGVVLKGRPIRYEEIAAQLGRSVRAARANIVRLRKAGYVTTKRSRDGLVFAIANPKKRFRRVAENSHSRVAEKCHSQTPDRQNSASLEWQKNVARVAENCHSRYISTSKTTNTAELFDAFWKSYPRKVAKPQARRAFDHVVLGGKPPQGATADDFGGLATAEARLERLTANTPSWAREYAKRPADKIPHPATFLNRLDWIAKPERNVGEPKRAWEGVGDLRRAWE